MSRNVIAALALLVCGLVWGRARSLPRVEPVYPLPWSPGSQLAPFAVPPHAPLPIVPDGEAREDSLNARSLLWRPPGSSRSFVLYVGVSGHHWARLYPDRGELVTLLDRGGGLSALPQDAWLSLGYADDDFLDDDDGDGDPLDPGELQAPGIGVPVFLHRRGL